RHRCALVLSRGVHALAPWATYRSPAGISLYLVVAIHGGRDRYFGAWRTCIWRSCSRCWRCLRMVLLLLASCDRTRSTAHSWAWTWQRHLTRRSANGHPFLPSPFVEEESSMAIGLWPYDETLVRHKEHDVRD